MRIILLIIVLLLSFPLPGDTASISFVVTWNVVDYAVLNINYPDTKIASSDSNFAINPEPIISYQCNSECQLIKDSDNNIITLQVE